MQLMSESHNGASGLLWSGLVSSGRVGLWIGMSLFKPYGGAVQNACIALVLAGADADACLARNRESAETETQFPFYICAETKEKGQKNYELLGGDDRIIIKMKTNRM